MVDHRTDGHREREYEHRAPRSGMVLAQGQGQAWEECGRRPRDRCHHALPPRAATGSLLTFVERLALRAFGVLRQHAFAPARSEGTHLVGRQAVERTERLAQEVVALEGGEVRRLERRVDALKGALGGDERRMERPDDRDGRGEQRAQPATKKRSHTRRVVSVGSALRKARRSHCVETMERSRSRSRRTRRGPSRSAGSSSRRSSSTRQSTRTPTISDV